MHIGPDDAVLVIDGRKALLLQNKGTATAPDFAPVFGEEMPNPPDHEQKSDADGRAPAMMRRGQSTTQSTDYHQDTEDGFAKETARRLAAMVERGAFDRLVVVAAPRTLGVLRQNYSKRLADAIRVEIAKDMTGTSVERISQMLDAYESA